MAMTYERALLIAMAMAGTSGKGPLKNTADQNKLES